MGCKYVKDFDFGESKTYVKGYARGGPTGGMNPGQGPVARPPMGRPGPTGGMNPGQGPVARPPMAFAKGGKVSSNIKQDKATAKVAVHKHEKAQHPGAPLTKLCGGGAVKKK